MNAVVEKVKRPNGPVPATQTFPEPLNRLGEEFETLFNRIGNYLPFPIEFGRFLEPVWGLEVEDLEKEMVIRMEVPGFEPEDFNVHITGGLLKIVATPKGVPEEKKEWYFARHRKYGQVVRTITLPTGLDFTKVEALYRNGILVLRLPKLPEAMSIKVPVKV